MNRTIVMIMAGGKGNRLGPLTCHRAKPALPFSGRYRIIDFVLSNLLHSGYRRIYVLTQYMATSLIQHLNATWHISGIDGFIEVVPAQMRAGAHWYRGTADSVYQNLNLIQNTDSENVAIFGGDHIYTCAVDQMEQRHRQTRADLTVAAFPVPREEASRFGVIQVDEEGRIVGFQEKPRHPTPLPGCPDTCLVSMGNYIFRTGVLQQALQRSTLLPNYAHDFGKNIIPELLRDGRRVFVYNFDENRVPGEVETPPYWRDVGTIDSYFQANMEVRERLPPLDLYNERWYIRTAQRALPPVRFVRPSHEESAADLIDSLICEGSIVSSARLRKGVIGYDCYIDSGASIDEGILLSGCRVGAGAALRRVILDRNCFIAPGVQIGVDPEEDARRFPFITRGGVVVLPKGTRVPISGPIELAYDIAQRLLEDASMRQQLARHADRYQISSPDRHSDRSVGPSNRLEFGHSPLPRPVPQLVADRAAPFMAAQ